MSRGFRDEDVTQAMTDKAMADTVSRVLEQEAEQEARSADRRQHGEAGSCEDCGRPIGAERLAALPTSTRCVRCQSAWEQANR
ncbi:MAG: TraR/DksA family transcriptional regulator [Chloroflexi bacterium]|nr:MAG: TraR/DksA family transcriptional regulator [Chloroflexota bacterium]TMD81258.1 MAG: TraR/DksA family transcriptional regulator [Chloroflexota bacterium]TMF06822.1 MAG: TraR/DksA family transcriptional regulator [Chloroflexota bacterium]TMG24433.1 MAG: TraR/DksA family transcriptional regulator [Chloroflexota bacterium]